MHTIITDWIDITNKIKTKQYQTNKEIASALDKKLLETNVYYKVIDKVSVIGEIIQVDYIKTDDTIKVKILFYQTKSQDIINMNNSKSLVDLVLINI